MKSAELDRATKPGRLNNKCTRVLSSQNGQVAVEYVLLLVVGVTIWLTLVKAFVSRDPNSPGMVVKKWQQIVQFVGQDRIEK